MKKFVKKLSIVATSFAMMAGVMATNAGAIVLNPEYVGVNAALQDQINEHRETQETAHAMAEAARALGLAETSETIITAQEIWADSQTEIDNLTAAISASQDVEIPFGPHSTTNLSASAFNKMLEGTPMAGCGDALVRMEQTTGTNGLFTIGVANSESSFGAACYNNNPFGILSSGGLRYFDSFDSAIQYFGSLIAGNEGVSAYARATTIEGINDIYCPGDGHYWSYKVRNTMNNCLAKIS